MNKKINILFLFLVAGLTSCATPHKAELIKAVDSITSDELAQMVNTLNTNTEEWIMIVFEKEPIERGIVRLKDGEIVRFAFLSHHLTKDHESHTVFENATYQRHVTGYFCCEVDFRTKQPENIKEFDKLLSSIDGLSP
jgi:hypothetical protein